VAVPSGRKALDFDDAVLGRLAESIDTIVSGVLADGDADFSAGALYFLAFFVAGACAENHSCCSQRYRKFY